MRTNTRHQAGKPMRRAPIILASILVSLFVLSNSYAGNPYKWIDHEGNVVYSQQPPTDGTHYEQIRTRESSRSGSESGAANATLSARESIRQDAIKNEKNAIVKKAMEKNAAERKDNCKLAKDHLRFYQVQRRWKDKNGNIKSLDDKDRMKKLDESKQQVADYCS